MSLVIFSTHEKYPSFTLYSPMSTTSLPHTGINERDSVDALLVVGTHCTYSLCGQIDFLPFTCDFCSKSFCSSHIRGKDHECPEFKEIEKENTMPKCPVCSSFVKLRAGESPDVVVDRHIASGCVTGKLFDPEEKRKLRDSLRCGAGSCMNHSRNKLSTMSCPRCGLQVCLSHRYYDDHGCEKVLAQKKAEQAQKAEESGSISGYFSSLSSSTSSLLQRLRGKKESMSEEEKQQDVVKRQQQRERALAGKKGSAKVAVKDSNSNVKVT